MCFDEFRDIFRFAWTKASTIITRNSKVTSHIKKRRLYQKIVKSGHTMHALESKSTNVDALWPHTAVKQLITFRDRYCQFK